MKRLKHNYSDYYFIIYDQDDELVGLFNSIDELHTRLKVNIPTIYQALYKNSNITIDNHYYKIYKFKNFFVENKG